MASAYLVHNAEGGEVVGPEARGKEHQRLKEGLVKSHGQAHGHRQAEKRLDAGRAERLRCKAIPALDMELFDFEAGRSWRWQRTAASEPRAAKRATNARCPLPPSCAAAPGRVAPVDVVDEQLHGRRRCRGQGRPNKAQSLPAACAVDEELVEANVEGNGAHGHNCAGHDNALGLVAERVGVGVEVEV